MEKQSDKYTLNKIDFKKIAIGAGVAIAGALLTYLAEVIGQIDFGEYTPVVVASVSIVINVLRRFVIGK